MILAFLFAAAAPSVIDAENAFARDAGIRTLAPLL